jgi:hypothetical protein
MKFREGLGSIVSFNPNNQTSTFDDNQVGKVYGIITTENTPNKELFEANGGFDGIGTIFYLDYNESTKNLNSLDDLSICNIAKPFHSSNQNYPLVGELVKLMNGPSPDTQISKISNQKYYTGVINIWNNTQQNSPSGNDLGLTFTENSDLRNLISFEGDRIYQGRKGNGIRFGSTVKLKSNINEWSNIGNDGDPITILVNGYVTSNTGSLSPNVEEINKEKSSIYLTSTQALPLIPSVSIVNPQINSIKPRDYSNPQIILNSDRITINSKKDEILLFAKTNIELNTNNAINLNSNKVIHFHSPYIMLGTTNDGKYPSEPALLGNKTHDLLLDLCKTLSNLASYLATATVATSEGAISVTSCNMAGEQLFADVENLINKLENITSDKTFLV